MARNASKTRIGAKVYYLHTQEWFYSYPKGTGTAREALTAWTSFRMGSSGSQLNEVYYSRDIPDRYNPQ